MKLNSKRKIIVVVFFLLVGVTGLTYFRLSKPNFANNQELTISAGVVPHHLLAEEIIVDFFDYIDSKEDPERIILLSPDHFKTGDIIGNSFISLNADTERFYGLEMDHDLIENLSFKNEIVLNNPAINYDHGITDLMPFIENRFPDTKIAPFLIPASISKEKVEKFVHSLNSLTCPETIVIASVDFSHYLTPGAADFHDVKSIRTLINFEKEGFPDLEVDSWHSLYVARKFAKLRKKESPGFIRHANSTDFLPEGDVGEMTSYFSVVFEDGKAGRGFSGKTVLITGNIVVDNQVEKLITEENKYYPLRQISQFLKGVDLVAGGMEFSFPDLAINNPTNFFKDLTEILSWARFDLILTTDHVDLNSEQNKSEEFFEKTEIDTATPASKNNFFEKEGVAFLSFDENTDSDLSSEKIKELIESIRKKNPDYFLITIIHRSGNTEGKNKDAWKGLAYNTIDFGADLVVGKGTGFTKKIEEYEGKLIFSSLGGFLTGRNSQKTGFSLGVEIYPEKTVYRIFPIENKIGQLSLMSPSDRKSFLINLSEKSSPGLIDEIRSGTIKKDNQ